MLLSSLWDHQTKSLSLWYPNIILRVHSHCWRSRDELISDVILWTSTHGRAKAGRPARTYIQQLCEDLPEAMNDREKWRERVRDIRATSTTWWWYYHRYRACFLYEYSKPHIHAYVCMYVCMYKLTGCYLTIILACGLQFQQWPWQNLLGVFRRIKNIYIWRLHTV